MAGKNYATFFNPKRKPVYLGTTISYPRKGNSLDVARLKQMKSIDSCICSYDIIDTDKIIKVNKIYDKIFRVETETEVYIVLKV